MLPGKGLSRKLFCIFMSILLLSLLVESAVVYRVSYQLSSESLDKSTQIVMQNYAQNIEGFFLRTETICELMKAEIPSLLPELTDDTGNFYDQFRFYRTLRQKFDTFCQSAIGRGIRYRAYLCLHDSFPMCHFLPEGKLIDTSTGVSPHSATSFSVVRESQLTSRSWYQNAVRNKGLPFWFMDPENPDTIWIVCSLEDDFLENYAVVHHSIGIFLIGIDASWITGELNKSLEDTSSLFFITDSGNRIIYARDASLLNQDINSLYTLTDGDGQGSSTIVLQGTPCHVLESTVADKLHLFFLLPEQSLRHQIRADLAILLWMLLLIVAAGICLSAFFSHYIARPIRLLSTHMAVQEQLSPIAPHKSRDEIGTLYRCFNDMVDKQSALISQIYSYSEAEKQLKYQMLQAQINPHFLYNTLDSVGCAALMQGNGELTDVLSSLADLLRYNISQPEQLVTLAEEALISDAYVRIQKFRYENLQYTKDLAPETLEIRMPKSILQPLIENCIMYGGTGKEGQRCVSLSSRVCRSDGHVSIILYNHIPADSRESSPADLLNRYLAGDCQLQRRSSGLGIRNIQQRVQLVFGKEYGLRYEQQGDLLAAIVALPMFE